MSLEAMCAAEDTTGCAQAILSGKHADAAKSFIPAEVLSKFLEHRSVTRVHTQFTADSRRMAASAVGFPDEVEYDFPCRGLCKADTPEESMEMFQAVLRAFAGIVGRCDQIGQVALQDLLLACEAVRGDEVSLSLWWMVIASGRAAHHEPTQTFIRLRPSRGGPQPRCAEDVVGTTLHMDMHSLVRQSSDLPEPFDHAAAPPMFFDEATVASQIVKGSGRQELPPSVVVVHKLKFVDIPQSSSVQVIGMDVEFEKCMVFPKPLAAARATKKARTTQEVPDFLSLLEAEVRGVPIEDGQPHGQLPTDKQVDTTFGDDEDLFSDILAMAGEQALVQAVGLHELLVEEEDLGEEARDRGRRQGKGRASRRSVGEDGGSSDECGDVGGTDHDVDCTIPSIAEGGVQIREPDRVELASLQDGRAASITTGSVVLEFTGSRTGIIGRYLSSTGDTVEVLHQIRNRSWKATCKLHKNCILWISRKGDMQDAAADRKAHADTCQWIADGMPGGPSNSEDGHWAAARVLKQAYGMRVK
jgi:hypothetical protein